MLVNLDTSPAGQRPGWLKARAPGGENYHEVKRLVTRSSLHTVCESAHCPNIGECWEHRTATFMILGNVCTRRCGFCAVQKGAPLAVDWDEPLRVARAVAALRLHYAVVTSVDRDDRKDGGAALFARTIEEIRQLNPGCKVEVLIPDFQGKTEALKMVLEARPDVLNHNIETVERLYKPVRPGSRYRRSLELLRASKQLAPQIPTKSGLMLGLGEEWDEVVVTLGDLRSHLVELVTIGQYLRPSPRHLPIARYYTPEEFAQLKQVAADLGFRHVESGPLVRSSYHAQRALI
jgi:lipoic acid synthetase